MKITTITTILIGLPSLVSAFSVSVANNAIFGDPSLPLRDNTGAPLTSGSIAVGFFASDEAVRSNSLDFTALLAGFQQFGTTAAISQANAPSLIDIQTPAEFTVTVPFGTEAGAAGQEQVGESVFVVIGNAATLAGSDQLAVFRAEDIFGTDLSTGVSVTAVVNLASDEGELLLGQNTGENQVGGAITYSNEIRLVEAVPEPSTSLLAGLAGLGLAFRRRR